MTQNKKILNDLTPVYDFRKGYELLVIPAAAGNVTMQVTNLLPLGSILGTFYQDGSGNRTFTINGVIMPVNPAANSATLWGLYFDGSHYFTTSNFSTGSAQTATPNTTPAAPTVIADDAADTLDFTHTLGDAEILISVNDAAYAQFDGNVINVGNVARPAGYWKAKIKSATGRNESAVASSPAFNIAANNYFAGFTANTYEIANGNLIDTAGVFTNNGQAGIGVDNHKFTNGGIYIAQYPSGGAAYSFGLSADSNTIEAILFIGYDYNGTNMIAIRQGSAQASYPPPVAGIYYGIRWHNVGGTMTFELVSTTDGATFTVIHTYTYTGGVGSNWYPKISLSVAGSQLNYPQSTPLT